MAAEKWTATRFAEHVENTLGWAPTDTEVQPRWKSLMLVAGRINKRIASNPTLYTWDNLLVTVLWLKRLGKEVSPLGVFWYVEEAVKKRPVIEATDDLAGKVFTALTEAMVAGEQDWVDQLARARGEARHDVLAGWVKFRG
jgi:hypothetical protein